MIDLNSVKMGSDAEVFLQLKTGQMIPACGLIGGTKEEPLVLSEDGCAVQEDNVMLEFNTPISSNRDEWARNIRKAMELAFAKIPPTMYPAIQATARFEEVLLENPQAQRFGCEPDYNAWTLEQNPRPIPTDHTMRSAAAHVHISWANPEGIDQRCRVIQMADIFVSLPSLWESVDRERRKLYGKAGAFRPKEYGVEHRVLDNYWLIDPVTTDMIYKRYMQAINAANTDVDVSDVAKEIQECINGYHVAIAKKLYTDLKKRIFPIKKDEFNFHNW